MGERRPRIIENDDKGTARLDQRAPDPASRTTSSRRAMRGAAAQQAIGDFLERVGVDRFGRAASVLSQPRRGTFAPFGKAPRQTDHKEQH